MARIITDYLEKAAENQPDKLAYSDSVRELTFYETRKEAYQVAAALIERNIFRKPVAILMGRCVEVVTTVFGIAYSGNFYSIMDADMPLKRLKKMFSVLMPSVVVCDQEHETVAEQLLQMRDGLEVYDFEIMPYDNRIYRDVSRIEIHSITKRILSSDILYVLFTSGSTGVPKGVVMPHKAAVNSVEGISDAFLLTEDSRLGSLFPFYSVCFVNDIFGTAYTKCTTFIVPKMLSYAPNDMVNFFRRNRLTCIWTPVSLMKLLIYYQAFSEVRLPDIKSIMFGGEAMPADLLKKLYEAMPNITFINGYGTTETGGVCHHVLYNFKKGSIVGILIGEPIGNQELMLFDDAGDMVMEGSGEVYVRGASLAYGYYRDSEQTKLAFVQNPLHNDYPDIVYRTGDIMKYNEEGELVYVGRKGTMINRRGYRIELGEIESLAYTTGRIKECVCIYSEISEKITIFFSGNLKEEEVRKKLGECLPNYMLPDIYIKMEELPHNTNGKTDRRKLREFLDDEGLI